MIRENGKLPNCVISLGIIKQVIPISFQYKPFVSAICNCDFAKNSAEYHSFELGLYLLNSLHGLFPQDYKDRVRWKSPP